MKRLYAAAVLIAVALIICIASSIAVEKYAVEMQVILEKAGNEILSGEIKNSEHTLVEAQLKWKKTERLFSLIVDADKIEEMSIDFSMIREHLEDGNIEHSLERVRECVLLLSEIAENEKLSIKNIM